MELPVTELFTMKVHLRGCKPFSEWFFHWTLDNDGHPIDKFWATHEKSEALDAIHEFSCKRDRFKVEEWRYNTKESDSPELIRSITIPSSKLEVKQSTWPAKFKKKFNKFREVRDYYKQDKQNKKEE